MSSQAAHHFIWKLIDPEYMSHGKIRSERIIAISRVNMFLWRAPQSGRSSRRVTLNGSGPASAPRQRTA